MTIAHRSRADHRANWRRSRRGITARAALLAASLLLLGLALRSVAPRDLLAVLAELTLDELVALALVNALLFASFTARLWLFLRVQGYPIPLRHLLAYRLTTFGISYFTPGPHLGGEPYQVYALVRRHQVPLPPAVAAVTVDKLLEMLFNFSFLAGGVLLLLLHQPGAVPWPEQPLALYALVPLLLPAGLLIALALGRCPLSGSLNAVDSLSQRLWSRPLLAPPRRETIRHSEEAAGLLCRRNPALLLAAGGLSLLSWLGLIGEFWLLTRMLELPLSLTDAATALVAARIAILLPLPAGLGALEASQSLAMSSLGLDPGIGIAISLLLRSRDVVMGLSGLWLGGLRYWQWAAKPAPAGAVGPPAPLAAEPSLLAGGAGPTPPS
ncbi:MAG TPA: lysylphosphatidylglycerol synthase transmembrane domain-containing protein [Caldilineaceae bacterium]|nr:lysylphosphatidylglycerol synthase transmembrane domain-containing protein [Caldilineaceae bacterium]